MQNEYPVEGRFSNPKLSALYGRQNVFVLVGQICAWALLLLAVDAASWWPAKVALVLIFCTVMQGVFSLMHECFHSNAHPNPKVNYAIGFTASLFFGTAFTSHLVNHWGHHIRNRTPAEQGEFIHEGESAAGKIALYYFAVCGGLWLSSLLMPLICFFLPYRTVEWLSKQARYNTYSAAFRQFKARDWSRMRLETVALVLFWISVIRFMPVQTTTLVVCYAAFVFSWSSLQWIYHLHTPLHLTEGAYNLRLPAPMRWLFLNFNCNLTHHRQSHLPWQELYKATDVRETQPLWYRWLLLFRWPIPFPKDLSILEKRYF